MATPTTPTASNGVDTFPSDVKRAGWVMIAAAGWTAYVWVSRIINLGQDDRSTGFLVVHYAIAAISLAFAGALAVFGIRFVRR